MVECLEEIVTAACKGQKRFPRHIRVVQAHGPLRKAIAEEDEEQDFEAENKKAELELVKKHARAQLLKDQ